VRPPNCVFPDDSLADMEMRIQDRMLAESAKRKRDGIGGSALCVGWERLALSLRRPTRKTNVLFVSTCPP
jgi:hypothetical protein